MRQSCKYLAQMMEYITPLIIEGNTPLQLDKAAYDFIVDHKCKSAFLGYNVGFGPFPNTLCIGINDMALHGIPSSIPFKKGDIVTIDAGLVWKGFYSDMARTFTIGNVSKDKKIFIDTVRQAVDKAILEAQDGNHVGDISYAIHSNSRPYHPLRDFSAHGIGQKLHMDPIIPMAYGNKGDGMLLQSGMTLAIEANVNMGNEEIVTDESGWTTHTKDGSMFALFENTILITGTGVEILTLP